jgi:hypothetical protein
MCAPVSVAVGGMGEALAPQSAAIVKFMIDGFVFFFGATIAWESLNPLKKLKLKKSE